MLKKLLFLLLVFSSFSTFAQDSGFYFGIGAHATFQKPKNINFILDRYNDTRTDCSVYCVSKDMPHFSFTSGPAFNAGFIIEKFIVEVNWVGRKRKLTTMGDFPNGDQGTRQLRFRMHSFGMGMGGFIGEKKIRFIPMFSFDFGNHRVDNRAIQAGEISDVDFTTVEKNLNIGMSVSTGILFYLNNRQSLGLMVRPEYQVWALKTDYSTLNNTINAATAGADPDELKANLSNFGLWLSLMVIIND